MSNPQPVNHRFAHHQSLHHRSPPTRLLMKATEPVVSTILDLKSSVPGGDQNFIYGRLEYQLDEMQAQAEAAGIQLQEIDQASFALVSFIDEILMHSNWTYRTRWPLLQYERFQTHRAGDQFFIHLNTILGQTFDPTVWQDPARANLLEIYYLCLLLGFSGKLGFAGEESYRRHMAQVRAHIQAKPYGALSPHLHPRNLYDVMEIYQPWRWWVGVGINVFILLLILLILIYWVWL